MIEVFVTIKDSTRRYYLLKIQKRNLDVYCIPPNLGMHFSLHKSGVSHIKTEKSIKQNREEPPVIIQSGEAGIVSGNNIVRGSLSDLGRAVGICSVHYPIDTLDVDFQEFTRNPDECFVIDKDSSFKGAKGIEIGVWAVPDRNKISFEFCNPGIHTDLVYKVAQCEPQIWIYAKPSVLFT